MRYFRSCAKNQKKLTDAQIEALKKIGGAEAAAIQKNSESFAKVADAEANLKDAEANLKDAEAEMCRQAAADFLKAHTMAEEARNALSSTWSWWPF